MRQLCHKALEGVLIFLIVFTPLVFGSVQVWSVTVIKLTVLAMGFLWILRCSVSGKFEFVKSPLNLLIVLWLGFVSFQLLATTSYFHATKEELFKHFFQ